MGVTAVDADAADGTTDAPADGEEHLSLAAGTQALVRVPSMRSPLWTLPPAALDNLLVVSATRPPGAVERLVRDRGGDPERVGVVPVSGSPVSYDGPMWTSDAVTPADLSGISEAVGTATRYVKPGEGWIVLDNVNVLLMYASGIGVQGLARSLVARSRRRRARGVYAVVPEALSAGTYRSIESVFDLTVDRTDAEP